jgi:hypothetical protein
MMEPLTSQSAPDGKIALCKTCSTALRTCTLEAWRLQPQRIDLHTSLRTFIEAALQGCLLCRHIIRELGPKGEHLFWKIAHASVHVVGLPTSKALTSISIRFETDYPAVATILWLLSYFTDDVQLPMEMKKDIEAIPDGAGTDKANPNLGFDTIWRLHRLPDSADSCPKNGRSKTPDILGIRHTILC